ncbi:hypothetical protein ABIF97_006990 [Bradyrhizobium japonicum]
MRGPRVAFNRTASIPLQLQGANSTGADQGETVMRTSRAWHALLLPLAFTGTLSIASAAS